MSKRAISIGDAIYIEEENGEPRIMYTSNGVSRQAVIFLTRETSIAIRDYLNKVYTR